MLNRIDAAGLGLNIVGLDVLTDLAGGIYCSLAGDTDNAKIYFAGTILPVSGGAIKMSKNTINLIAKGKVTMVRINGLAKLMPDLQFDVYSHLFKKLNNVANEAEEIHNQVIKHSTLASNFTAEYAELIVKASEGRTKVLAQLGGWDEKLIKQFASDLKNPNFAKAFFNKVGKQPELVESWKKLDDLGFSQTARRNIDNLNQRSIIDEYADNIASASNARKGNFGEIGADLDLNGKGYESLMSKRIDDIDAAGHNGLDGVYRKNGQYYIVEGKYTGSASLNPANDATGLPRQMSDDWIATRNWDGVNLEQSEIRNLITNKNYQRVLAKVAPDGSVTYRLVDDDGYAITGNAGVFNP